MNKRPIRCRDFKTGEIIAEYESVAAAARTLKKRNTSAIIAAANGLAYTAYGFQWEYIPKDSYVPKVNKLPKRPFTRKQAIKYMKNNQNKSYVQLSEHTGLSIDELRKIYNEEKLYRA